MPVKPISILKTYFETGDRPTELQFTDLVDSFIHKTAGTIVTAKSYDEATGVVLLEFSDATSLTFTVSKSESEEIGFINGLASALDSKVDKVVGKELSTNNFTNELKTKLENLTQVELPLSYEIAFINGLADALGLKANDSEVVKTVNGELPDENGNVNLLTPIGSGMVDINAETTKLNRYCFGQKAGINRGEPFMGWRSTVAEPLSNADFDIKIAQL